MIWYGHEGVGRDDDLVCEAAGRVLDAVEGCTGTEVPPPCLAEIAVFLPEVAIVKSWVDGDLLPKLEAGDVRSQFRYRATEFMA